MCIKLNKEGMLATVISGVMEVHDYYLLQCIL